MTVDEARIGSANAEPARHDAKRRGTRCGRATASTSARSNWNRLVARVAANRRSTDQTNKQSVFMPLLVHPLWARGDLVHPLWARGVRLRTFAMLRDDVRRSHGFCGAGCMALRQRLGSQRRASANIFA